MDKFDTIVRFAEWLAMPLVYFVLLMLFLFFVVRPFFSYLFSWNRINAIKTLQEIEQEKEAQEEAEAALAEPEEDDDSFVPPPPGSQEEQQMMSKLAKSNPEKAGTLVKQWLQKDQS